MIPSPTSQPFYYYNNVPTKASTISSQKTSRVFLTILLMTLIMASISCLFLTPQYWEIGILGVTTLSIVILSCCLFACCGGCVVSIDETQQALSNEKNEDKLDAKKSNPKSWSTEELSDYSRSGSLTSLASI